MYSYRKSSRGDDSKTFSLFNQLRDSLSGLDAYLKALSRKIAEDIRPPDPEKHPEYEPARQIRREMRKIDKGLAKQVNLEELLD